MAKFSSLPMIARGQRARLRDVECTTLGGAPFSCDLRILNAHEEQRVVAAACAASRDAGGTAKEDDLVYQYAFAVEVVALAAVDPASPEDAPSKFFEDANEVRTHLDRERILLLAEQQRRFQERVSPRRHSLTEEEFVSLVAACATAEEGEDLPFEILPRQSRNLFVRRMALQLSISPPSKSPTSSGGAVEGAA